MKQVTMYKIPYTHVTTEAMTTAHLATGVSNAVLCAMYDVNFTRLQINGATVNCSCIINLMYELIKLSMCGSHGFSSDVCMRNFVHGDLFHYFLMI